MASTAQERARKGAIGEAKANLAGASVALREGDGDLATARDFITKAGAAIDRADAYTATPKAAE